jgi:hypothetical protein
MPMEERIRFARPIGRSVPWLVCPMVPGSPRGAWTWWSSMFERDRITQGDPPKTSLVDPHRVAAADVIVTAAESKSGTWLDFLE